MAMLIQDFRFKHNVRKLWDATGRTEKWRQAGWAEESLPKDEDKVAEGMIVALDPPFGMHIHCSLWGGEKIVSIVGYGGHIAAAKVIVTKVDDSIEVIDIPKGVEDLDKLMWEEFFKHIPEGAHKAVKSILRLEK